MKNIYIFSWMNYSDIERFVATRKIINSPIYQEACYDQAHKDMIIKELIDHDYIICGDTHQSYVKNCIPVFNDGYIFLSMRTWGELMAEAMNIKEHTTKYTYMDFYIASVCKKKEKYHK